MLNKKLVAVSPPAESLFNAGKENSFWPEDIQSNPEVLAQSKLRRVLFARLENLFRQIPNADIEITSAVDSGVIEAENVAEIYELLSDFIEADPRNKRLILYLPFELIPAKTWKRPSDGFAESANRFAESYSKNWKELLKEIDVRANFSDGDILEPELSPNGQKMVCKAAHLTPKLVQKGLVSATSVLDMADNDKVGILKDSIIDALPVIAGDMPLADYEIKRIKDLSSFSFRKETRPKTSTETLSKEKNKDWLEKLDPNSEFEMKKIEMRFALDMSKGMPKLRVAWEKQDRENKLVERYAFDIAAMMVGGFLTADDTRSFIKSSKNKIVRLAVIRGVRMAIENIWVTSQKKAKETFFAHEERFKELWLKSEPRMKDELTVALTRLANLGVIGGLYIEENFSFRLMRPDEPVSDGRNIIGDEIEEFLPALKRAVKSKEISGVIYPVVIFFGSRLKGYAKENADLDIAVFVRPGVSKTERPKIRKMLSRIFSSEKVGGKIVEFWLTEKDGELQVRNFSNSDVFLADSTWVHLLFASVWVGAEEEIRDIYRRLLSGFIFSKGKKFDERSAREIWLDQIERETLQYRLMHKGYRRIYSEQGSVLSENAQDLDPQSSFWDSGYRRLATKLFVARVYMPQLAKAKSNK